MRAVNDTLSPGYRALLDTVAGSEAPDYNYMYGGQRFQDYGDHPRQPQLITSGPNAGKYSSAAGRYQMLGSTWDDAKNTLGLPDFSPKNQDTAAAWLAERSYKQKTGRNLQEDIDAAGNDPTKLGMIAPHLAGTWTSLPGGIEPNNATNSFGQRFAKNLSGYTNQGTSDAMAGPMSLAPQDYGALSARNVVGPGVFTPQNPQDLPTVPQQAPAPEKMSGWDALAAGGNAFAHAGAGLAAIGNPAAGAAMAQAIAPEEQWGVHFDPVTGAMFKVSKSGKVVPVTAGMKGERVTDAALKELTSTNNAQLGALQGTSKEARELRDLIDNGTLDVSAWSRAKSMGKNLIGASDEQSRAIAKLDAFVNSLELNKQVLQKGPQTDKDAERIYGSFISKLGSMDNKTLGQSLDELLQSNNRSVSNYRTSLDAYKTRYRGSGDTFSELQKPFDTYDAEHKTWSDARASRRAPAGPVMSGDGFKVLGVRGPNQ